MNDFIHLPGYGEYLSRWINLSYVETVNKLAEDKVMIIYATNRRETLSGCWARVVLDYLGETQYQEMLTNTVECGDRQAPGFNPGEPVTKYFDEV